jgi:acyl carrier protein
MVPSRFVFLETLPLTPNGKVDRRALPIPSRSRPELDTPYVRPGTPVEGALARIWAEVLCLDEVGIHDSFLDLGGHSLSAAKILSRVHDFFDLDLPLSGIFDKPTIAEFSAIITQRPCAKSESDRH